MTAVNINECVKVKLTDYGWSILNGWGAIRKDTEKFPDLDKIAAYNKENRITPYNDSN